MAFSSYYHSHHHHVFDVPAVRRRAKSKRPVPEIFRRPYDAELIDAEFSEIGRDPRFLPGWYILPGAMLGVVMLGLVLWLLLA
jgi:hypothetical protein